MCKLICSDGCSPPGRHLSFYLNEAGTYNYMRGAQGTPSSLIPGFNEFHYSFLIYIFLQNKDSQIIN